MTTAERIISYMHIEKSCNRTPIEFSKIRSSAMLEDTKLFFKIFEQLQRERKVVRISNATETRDSLWDLPKEEE